MKLTITEIWFKRKRVATKLKYLFSLIFVASLSACTSNQNPPIVQGDSLLIPLNTSKIDGVNFTDANGKKQGRWETAVKQGTQFMVIEEMYYVDNVLDGTYVLRYNNGKIKEEGKYVKGLKEGEWKHYDEDGGIDKTETFKNGKSQGIEVYLK